MLYVTFLDVWKAKWTRTLVSDWLDLIQLATAKNSVPCKKIHKGLIKAMVSLTRVDEDAAIKTPPFFFLKVFSGSLVPWDGYLFVNGWIRCRRDGGLQFQFEPLRPQNWKV